MLFDLFNQIKYVNCHIIQAKTVIIKLTITFKRLNTQILQKLHSLYLSPQEKNFVYHRRVLRNN